MHILAVQLSCTLPIGPPQHCDAEIEHYTLPCRCAEQGKRGLTGLNVSVGWSGSRERVRWSWSRERRRSATSACRGPMASRAAAATLFRLPWIGISPRCFFATCSKKSHCVLSSQHSDLTALQRSQVLQSWGMVHIHVQKLLTGRKFTCVWNQACRALPYLSGT